MKNNLPLSYIEISKKNLIHNIKQFRNLIKAGTKISVAIKGNAYGHGQNIVAKILEPHVDYFQVNNVEELESLRKISQKKAFVLGYVQNSDLPRAIRSNCILTVFSLGQLKEINKISKKLKKIQEVCVPVDAYLGREGFLFSDLGEIFEEIKKSGYVKFTSIYAHFANIEDVSNFTHAQKQIKEYEKALELAKMFGFENPPRPVSTQGELGEAGPPRLGEAGLQTHISATSGILVYEKDSGINSIVRLGIGAYGMWPSEHLKKVYENEKFNLKPVLSWKTKIAQVKILEKGNTVGYGLTYKTNQKTKIAIIPQGYADGLDRGLSNKGEVLIGGARCKIIGRVSMNMFAVNVNHLSVVKVGDEVVIIGIQNKEKITAEQVAKKLDTINYEITTRISSLLPRVIT
ncbi:MAG: alanine racemase [Candidatus Paceibacterota bacterium]